MNRDYERHDMILWRSRWKPKQGEQFFYVTPEMLVGGDEYSIRDYDLKLMVEVGNCFRTITQASKALAMLKKTLKLFHQNN